jgi:hypothetical protein
VLVVSMRPILKAPGTQRLNPKYDGLVSILLQFCFNFAFNFNLRRSPEGPLVATTFASLGFDPHGRAWWILLATS